MELGRRAFLKLGGGAVVAGTGYAGYEEVTGGKWLFDPGTLTAARNKFFGLVDVSTLVEAAEKHADASPDDIETPSGTLDPSDVDQFAAVGSISISGDNGVPTSVLAGAASGSFDADLVEEPAEESSNVEEAGTASGYNLWTSEIPESAQSSELSFSPATVALGTQSGATVAGALRAPEANVESIDAVKQMISAKKGGVNHARYLTADGDYKSIRSQFDSNPTFLFGGIIDPALVTLVTSATEAGLALASEAAGPAGGFIDAATAFTDAWIEELSAGAVGGTIDTAAGETTLKTFLTYSTATDAEGTGIVQLANAAGAEADVDGLKELDARYEGRSVVIRATVETETLFEEGADPSVPTTTPTGFGRT